MVITTHKYIDEIRVKDSDTSLILGTIHPHKTEKFQVDFFYGNRNSIWTILAASFPDLDFRTKESIIKTLSINNIWISDMIRVCNRKDDKVTQDKDLEIVTYNKDQIRDGIQNSKIDTIFFTSKFGKNNAARLFCDQFNIDTRQITSREFVIPKDIFGREIKGFILFSPSGQANISISVSEQYRALKENYKTEKSPVSAFKIDTYRHVFRNHLCQKI